MFADNFCVSSSLLQINYPTDRFNVKIIVNDIQSMNFVSNTLAHAQILTSFRRENYKNFDKFISLQISRLYIQKEISAQIFDQLLVSAFFIIVSILEPVQRSLLNKSTLKTVLLWFEYQNVFQFYANLFFETFILKSTFNFKISIPIFANLGLDCCEKTEKRFEWAKEYFCPGSLSQIRTTFFSEK